MIRVIVERRAKEGKEAEVLDLMREVRGSAMSQPGYISGETLYHYEDPSIFISISMWGCAEYWRGWKNSAQRKALEDKLGPLMRDEPKITLLQHPPQDFLTGYYR
ncbi:MAG: antibiotic biosynthesis monooxygenase family protein [Dehalococcoidia bacterium]